MKPMELMDALGELPPELVEPVLSGQPITHGAETEIEEILSADQPITQSKSRSGGVFSKAAALTALAACLALSFGILKLIGNFQQAHNQIQGSELTAPAETGTSPAAISTEPVSELPDTAQTNPTRLLSRLAETEGCRLEDCIVLTNSIAPEPIQLLTPNKVYSIYKKRDSSIRIYTADGKKPDSDAILNKWKAYLRGCGIPEDTLEQLIRECTLTKSGGCWVVDTISEWNGHTIVEAIRTMPEISSIEIQDSFHTDDPDTTASNFEWYIQCSRPVTAADFPELTGAAVKALSTPYTQNRFTLKLSGDSYADYFSAAAYLRSLDYVTDLFLSYIVTEPGSGIERTLVDSAAPDGVPIRSSVKYSEAEKAEIMEAYKALKRFMHDYMDSDFPKASRYITSVDEVTYDDNLSTHYDSSVMHFTPEKEMRFTVTCANNETLSSSYRGGIGYLVSKIDGKWTTYAEYTSQPAYQTAVTGTETGGERTLLDTAAPDGVPMKSSVKYTEAEKAEIMEAYEALKRFMDNYLNVNIPGASKYITSVDDVVYDYDLYSHYDSSVMHFTPEKELRFSVTCAENETLSSSYLGGIGYLVSKIDGKWTTYTEYTNQPAHQTVYVTGTAGQTTQTTVSPQDIRTVTVNAREVYEWHDFAKNSDTDYTAVNESVRLSAFPEVTFSWNGAQSEITVTGRNEKPTIFGAMPLWNAFFTDVTGDGKPDLCTGGAYGSGQIALIVTVYDIADDKIYSLNERNEYDYMFRIVSGRLRLLKTRSMTGMNDAETGYPVIQDGNLCYSKDGKTVQKQPG